MVKKYPAEVISINQFIENMFTVKMRSTGRKFRFYPGQFLHLALDEYDPSEGWPESRCFSMQNPPGEDYIVITFSVKGEYTRRMADELRVGAEITLKLPYGDLFIEDHNKKNTVFIAGGTGITPFLSLFNDESFTQYSNPKLFSGFRNQSMNLYTNEINKAVEVNPSFMIKNYYEEEDGIIDVVDILDGAAEDSTFFISGPPEMITFFKKSLYTKGVGENQIRTDDWE
jgi:ferredoxin-NADP reductase